MPLLLESKCIINSWFVFPVFQITSLCCLSFPFHLHPECVSKRYNKEPNVCECLFHFIQLAIPLAEACICGVNKLVGKVLVIGWIVSPSLHLPRPFPDIFIHPFSRIVCPISSCRRFIGENQLNDKNEIFFIGQLNMWTCALPIFSSNWTFIFQFQTFINMATKYFFCK